MKSSSKLKILSIFVIISTCIQYSLSQDYPGLDDYPGDYSEEPLACAEPDYSGDGICDDQNNNADCDFDGGDCCGPHVDKTFCIKCECLEDNQEPDENFLDFFRSLSHVPQYHPTTIPPPNPCNTNPPCNGHGYCSPFGTVCDCKHGFTGDGCDTPPTPPPSPPPTNPCDTNPPCNGHGYCSPGGKVCTFCKHGYTGDGCEIPPTTTTPPKPNPCTTNPPCNGHGYCSGFGTVCDCKHGYTGDGCDTPPTPPPPPPPINPCTTSPPCNGHGYCSRFGTVCDCKHGYTGDGCEIPPGGGPCRLECNGQPCNSDNTACDCQNGSTEPDCSDFDPHGNQTHCVDVSTYTYPVWVKEPRKCCSTEFVKKEHKRWEEVCMNVTSLYCDVWPSTECEMKMSNVTLNTTTWQYVYFPKITCVPTYKKVVHMKKKPYCVKKPKYHCTSKWKMLPSGEKVWDGYDNCTVIYWDDCKLVDYNETIKVETPQCNVTHKIPYMTIVKKPTVEMVYKMECEVIKKTHCKAKTDESCKTIDYTETKEEPVKNCEHTYIKKTNAGTRT